jgi:hypothetical protein
MNRFAEFHNSNLYHIMKDDGHTVCQISVAAQNELYQTYAETDYPMPRIVSNPSPSRKLCSKCAEKTQ